MPAIREDLKVKEAKAYFKSITKPGMQKGERDYRNRAAAFSANGGGEAGYKLSADISDQSVQALQDESSTGNTLANFGPKKLNTQEIEERLKSVMRAQGVTDREFNIGTSFYEHDLREYLSLGMWHPSDEGRVEMQ